MRRSLYDRERVGTMGGKKCRFACLSPRVHEGRMAGIRLESEARLGKAIRLKIFF